MPFRPKLSSLLGCALVAVCATGCTASTPYRYTGLTPASKPMPFDGRTAPDGTLRVEGHLAAGSVREKPYAELHDTALLVPELTAEGSAMFAPTRGFELGARGTYAAYRSGQEATAGTMAIPSRGPTYGFGPEAHGTIRFGRTKAFGLGFAGNILWNSVPYAQWTKVGVDKAACGPGVACAVDQNNVKYALFTEARETHVTFSFTVVPSYAFGTAGEYGHVFGSFGFTTGFQNDGFANQAQNGSTIGSSGLLFVPGVGYGARLFDLLHASAMVYYPVTTLDSPVQYGPGGLFTLGFDFQLWEGRERAWQRRTRHEETDAPYMHNVPPPERRPPPVPRGTPGLTPAPVDPAVPAPVPQPTAPGDVTL